MELVCSTDLPILNYYIKHRNELCEFPTGNFYQKPPTNFVKFSITLVDFLEFVSIFPTAK